MRAVPAAVQAYRQAGKPIVERHLVWIAARNRATGAPEPAGFWTGREDRQISVTDPATGATVIRSYMAGGGLIEVEPVVHARGLEVRELRVSLSHVNAAVEVVVRGFDARAAAIEVHRLWLDFETRAALAPASVWTVGTVNAAPIVTPAAGDDGTGEAKLSIAVVPISRALTVGNPELLSDAVQQRRSGDRFLKYVAGTATREVLWGTA